MIAIIYGLYIFDYWCTSGLMALEIRYLNIDDSFGCHFYMTAPFLVHSNTDLACHKRSCLILS